MAEIQNKNIAVILSIGPDEALSNIQESIESIEHQDYLLGRIEIYCANDGNPKGEVCDFLFEKSKEPHFFLSTISESRGLAHALNLLIEQAMENCDAAFVARMDSDDISMPNRFSRQIQFLEQNVGVDLVGSDLLEFQDGSSHRKLKSMPKTWRAIERTIWLRCPLNHPTVVFRRSIFSKGFRYDEKLRVSQDYDFWLRLYLAGICFANIAEPLLLFRQTGNFLRKRGADKARLEFRFKIKYLIKSRSLNIISYCMVFSRLFVGHLPRRIIAILYSFSRKDLAQ